MHSLCGRGCHVAKIEGPQVIAACFPCRAPTVYPKTTMGMQWHTAPCSSLNESRQTWCTARCLGYTGCIGRHTFQISAARHNSVFCRRKLHPIYGAAWAGQRRAGLLCSRALPVLHSGSNMASRRIPIQQQQRRRLGLLQRRRRHRSGGALLQRLVAAHVRLLPS